MLRSFAERKALPKKPFLPSARKHPPGANRLLAMAKPWVVPIRYFASKNFVFYRWSLLIAYECHFSSTKYRIILSLDIRVCLDRGSAPVTPQAQ